ncbi:MAG: alkaline phosphatase [Bacteroidales bacterium]|nr:alkaline phosphatase [Bacteroidales bacterium]
MKKIVFSLSVILFSISVCAQTPKYVFYLIGDGMGLAQAYLTQQYNLAVSNGEKDLNFMNFPVRTFVSSYCSNSLVTDSAAGGTALATGEKTNSGQLGTRPDGSSIESLAEMAKKKGYGTGVVTSVGVNHATPAAFYAKVMSRNDYDTINEQLIAHSMDFAAGSTFLGTRKSPVKPEDWVEKAKAAGIEVFVGKDQYKPVKGKRVIYVSENLNSSQLPYNLDIKPEQTSLCDFTESAIEYLYSNFQKGFFLMIEGGLIDGAGHANDAAACVAEVNGFADAIDLVLAFYDKHPNETLIVITADHETGGLAIGNGEYAMHPEILANAGMSKEELTRRLIQMRSSGKEVNWSEIKDFLAENFGFWKTLKMNPAEERALTQAYKEYFLDFNSKQERNMYSTNEDFAVVVFKILEAKAMVSWRFLSHSGIPVMVYAKGAKADAFVGVKDNTEVAKAIKAVARY